MPRSKLSPTITRPTVRVESHQQLVNAQKARADAGMIRTNSQVGNIAATKRQEFVAQMAALSGEGAHFSRGGDVAAKKQSKVNYEKAKAAADEVVRQKTQAELAEFNSRQDFINQMAGLPAWSGMIKFDGAEIKVTRGIFYVGKQPYSVSRDGRAVINKDTLILVGEVVKGEVIPPTESLKNYLSAHNIGIAH